MYRSLDSQLDKAKRAADAAAVEDSIGAMQSKEDWICFNVLRDIQRTANPLSPPFITPEGSLVSDVQAKLAMLVETIFPMATLATNMSDSESPPTHTLPTATGLAAATEHELKAAVHAMDRNKSPGPDHIRPDLIKDLYEDCDGEAFRSHLLKVVNHCIQDGHFPCEWRTATISIIAKGGDRDLRLPKSYRPIALLCTASKLVESIICMRLQHALARKHPLVNQFGSVPGISTSHAVGSVLDAGRNAIRDKEKVALLTIDVASAFNQIDHARLRQIFDDIGLKSFGKWVYAWLQDRSVQLRLEGSTSPPYQMGSRGVPQGSPLSPLLWAIYIDSALHISPMSSAPVLQGAYVDDLFAVISSTSIPDLYADCQAWLDGLFAWCAERDINLDKPSFMVVSGSNPKRLELANVNLTLQDGSNIQTSQTSIKLLGVTIGAQASLREFIVRKCDSTLRTVNTLLWTMRSAGSVSTAVRWRIAKAILFPILDFASDLHPIIQRPLEPNVAKTEKAIYAFILGTQNTGSLPKGESMAHELGQLGALYRWKMQSLTLLARVLSNRNHTSSRAAANAVRRVRQGDMDPYVETITLFRIEGGKMDRGFSRAAPLISPFKVAATALPFDTIEPISLPIIAPYQWIPLDVSILERDVAIATEANIQKQQGKQAVRLYTDGSESKEPPQLTAAFIAYAQANPEHTWQDAAAIDPHSWDILEAELLAILLALRSCRPLPDTEDDSRSQPPWRRIDVFSDSQHSLNRLASTWASDRRHLQHLTTQIRAEVDWLKRHGTREIIFRWIPGHSHIQGNEAADNLARHCSTPTRPPTAEFGSIALLKRIAKDSAVSTQALSWENYASDSLFEVSPSFQPDEMILVRDCSSTLARLLLRFRSNVLCVAGHRQASDACICGDPKQTRAHVLLECTETVVTRLALQKFFRAEDRTSLRILLQGGHFDDSTLRQQYLAALSNHLTKCFRVIHDTNVNLGVFPETINEDTSFSYDNSVASSSAERSVEEMFAADRSWIHALDAAVREIDNAAAGDAERIDEDEGLPMEQASYQQEPQPAADQIAEEQDVAPDGRIIRRAGHCPTSTSTQMHEPVLSSSAPTEEELSVAADGRIIRRAGNRSNCTSTQMHEPGPSSAPSDEEEYLIAADGRIIRRRGTNQPK